MKKVYEDHELIAVIVEQVTIRRRLVDEYSKLVVDDDGFIPDVVLNLSYAEIRALTDRSHIRKSMLKKLMKGLRARGLVVNEGHHCLVIEKPVEEVDNKFDTLESLLLSNEEHLREA